MSGSVNKAIVVGNLGRDPEVRTGQSGTRVATFSVATTETWKDAATSERRQRTDWHRVVVFGDRLIEVVEGYLHKGSKVWVEGQMQTRKWKAQDGSDRYTTEVVLKPFRGTLVMLDTRRDGPPPAGSPEDYGTAQAAPEQPKDDAPPPFDDDIPF